MYYIKYLINRKKHSFRNNQDTIFQYKILLKYIIFEKQDKKNKHKYGKSKTL